MNGFIITFTEERGSRLQRVAHLLRSAKLRNPMNANNIERIATSAVCGFCLLLVSGCGPKERPLTQAEIQAAAKFYGGNPDFTATQISYMRDPRAPKSAEEEKVMETELAFSEGKRRDAITMSLTSPAFITITRPDRNRIYSVWGEGVNVVVEQPLRPPELADSPWPSPVKEKSEIGRETINGHPCIKCRVLTDDGGRIEWTTWEATDLNRFPIRAEYLNGGKIMRVEFTNVKLAKPDPSLFEPPKGYKKFNSKEKAFGYMMQKAR